MSNIVSSLAQRAEKSSTDGFGSGPLGQKQVVDYLRAAHMRIQPAIEKFRKPESSLSSCLRRARTSRNGFAFLVH